MTSKYFQRNLKKFLIKKFLNQFNSKKLIENNGKEKTERELTDDSWRDSEWYEKYPDDKFHYKYSYHKT